MKRLGNGHRTRREDPLIAAAVARALDFAEREATAEDQGAVS